MFTAVLKSVHGPIDVNDYYFVRVASIFSPQENIKKVTFLCDGAMTPCYGLVCLFESL